MSIFKVTFMTVPAAPHVYCQLFVANEPGAWALCGNVTMRKAEFQDFRLLCSRHEEQFQFEDVTPE